MADGCPACGASVPVQLLITDRYGRQWPLGVCDECGVEYQVQPMPEAERATFYGSGEYRRLCEQVTGQPWTNAEYLALQQRAYAYRLIGRVGPSLRHGVGRVWLDYGGSTGAVSGVWNAGVANMMRLDTAHVIVADYGDGAPYTPEQAWALGPYDTILCCQTLDHLAAPLETLQRFKDVACQEARLFVDVVKKAHTDYKIDHDTYYPTAQSFVGLVERAGWSIVWLDCETNPTHYAILAENV